MFGFGKKKSQVKSPAEMTAFERRQSMAMRFEQEERARSGGSATPPAATELIGKNIFDDGPKTSPKQKKSLLPKQSTDIPPPPGPPLAERRSVDPDYIEFTVVPLLLRAKVAYEEANKYGDTLKRMTEAEVKTIMANAANLVDDVKKCHIKVPPSFEKDVYDDMFWKAGPGNRKSFVYYRPSDAPLETPGRPKSDSSHDPVEKTREASRQRASFSGPALPALEETDPNRYKVRSRTKQAESLSNDLADLVQSLDALKTKN